MALNVGEQLGPYEILAPLGAGGMGEVYRARDTKLGREVAIKVLPEEFTQHPQKLARFEREARLLASLNHPGIATLHGLEEAEGKPFLVMELVEGETLADRISGGPIPVGEALTIAQQITEALEAAHEKGVVHRDLKPANIKVDPEGQVKVLDFGLAKAFADEVPESELSASPTLSRDATKAGVILGTAAYMSPEQARGKVVDKRTDIFSFGMVLYEMLTGKRAFKGEDVSDLLASIMKLEPDWKALPADVPPSLTKLLRRCLAKDRKNRLRDIGDVRFEIQEILAAPTDVSAQGPVALSTRPNTRTHVAWGLATLVAVFATAFTASRLLDPGPRLPTRLAVTLPVTDQLVLPSGIALSPDGRHLVYTGTRGGITQLYRRSMDELEPVPIRGTEGGLYPFFSPDGESIGFFADNTLKKVLLAGGTAVTLSAAGVPLGATWGPADTIVFASIARPGLMHVSASGGVPEPLTTVEAGEIYHMWPHILPDGHAVLFNVYTGSGVTTRIAAQSLESGERKILMEGSHARYSPTGHIVFGQQSSLSLWAAPFDTERLEMTGEQTPVLEEVLFTGGPFGLAHFALADDGSLVYVRGGNVQRNRTFVWVDREGHEEPIAAQPQAYEEFNLSRDGTRIAVRVTDEDDDLWIYDLVLETSIRLTFDPAGERFPLWTPDGQRVAFGGEDGMFWKPADGTGETEAIVESKSNQRPEAFSRDGDLLVFQDLSSGRDLGMVSLEGERASTLLLNSEFEERNAELSPDGHWLAYESNESGQVEVYVRPFPDVNAGKVQVSRDGGSWPIWAPDGRELFYVGPQDVHLMRVPIETDPAFTLGIREPAIVMEPYVTGGTSRRIAIHPDGQRFLMLKEGGESEDAASAASIIVVENWHEELKRLVPTN